MELLVVAHVGLGELGILAFLWLILEVAHGPSLGGVARAKLAGLSGMLLFFAAWIVAGIYYVVQYGSEIKPTILEGGWPWAHGIFTETKEHIFLFLPFLSVVVVALLWQNADTLVGKPKLKSAVVVLAGTTVLLGALMTVMGYFISSGYRHGLIS